MNLINMKGRSGQRPALFWGLMLLSFFILGVGCSNDTPKPEEPEPTREYPSNAKHWNAGQVLFGKENWTEVLVGDMPLVISVPHGGNVRPDGIPDRTCPDITTVRDLNTIELALAISDEFKETYGKRPYVIINHLSRVKIDQNREIENATCGNPLMMQAWHDYHNYTDSAVSTAVARHGYAIFIDLHGHGHQKQRLEIGYTLSGQELTQLYGGLNKDILGAKSSISNLLRMKPTLRFEDMISGDQAFGSLMAEGGFASIPSRTEPYPYDGDPYFDGGYNTRFYTSSTYPHVFGWQIECNNQGVRDSGDNRARFAKVFAGVIEKMKL